MTDEFIVGKFLGSYELLAVTLPVGAAGRRLFFDLAAVYGIDEEESSELFLKCVSKDVLSISTKNDFYIYNRMLSSGKIATGEFRDVICARGRALERVAEQGLKKCLSSGAETYEHLAGKAKGGSVCALYVLGVALFGGYGIESDKKTALKYLRKAARWNMPEAAVYLLARDEERRSEYAGILYGGALESYKGHVIKFLDRYKISPVTDAKAEMLTTIVSRKDVDADVIDPAVFNILHSNVLSLADKRVVLFSRSNELKGIVANIPVFLRGVEVLDVKVNPPLGRLDDVKKLEKVIRGLKNARREQYRPSMICCDEKYVRDEYGKALREAMMDCNVLSVDVAEADDSLFQPNNANVVFRSLEQKRPNVVIFYLHGVLSMDKMKFLKSFADTAERSRMNFMSGIKLQLSPVAPIFISDRLNVEAFRSLCNAFSVSSTTSTERENIIKATCEFECDMNDLSNVRIDSKAMDYLLEKQPDEAISLLKSFIFELDDSETITYELVKSYERGHVRPTIGFDTKSFDEVGVV